jgi:hypothetical protein
MVSTAATTTMPVRQDLFTAFSRSGVCANQQRQLAPLPMAVHVDETDFTQPVQLRLNVEKLVRRIFVFGLDVERG